MAKSALKRLVAPATSLDMEFEDIPLKAISELARIHDPFKQLAQAARLHDMLPDDEVISTIDPLIDSSSSELVDTLAEEDRRRRLPSTDPERIPGDYGVYLSPEKIIAAFEAHDAHASAQTEKLVDFAILHATSKDLRTTFEDARKLATEKGIHIMDALEIIRSQPAAFEPNAIRDGYDWLYEEKAS